MFPKLVYDCDRWNYANAKTQINFRNNFRRANQKSIMKIVGIPICEICINVASSNVSVNSEMMQRPQALGNTGASGSYYVHNWIGK